MDIILLKVFFGAMNCFSFIFERDDVFVNNESEIINISHDI